MQPITRASDVCHELGSSDFGVECISILQQFVLCVLCDSLEELGCAIIHSHIDLLVKIYCLCAFFFRKSATPVVPAAMSEL